MYVPLTKNTDSIKAMVACEEICFIIDITLKFFVNTYNI